MRPIAPLALVAGTLAAALVAHPAAAQQRPSFHAGMTWGDTRMRPRDSGLDDANVVMPSVVLGWTGPAGVQLEGRVSRLRAEASRAAGPMEFSGLWISTEATLAEAIVGWAPLRAKVGPLQPRVGLGLLWARARNGSRTDTPATFVRETYRGTTASAGLDVALAQFVAVRAQASWRSVSDDEVGHRAPYHLDGRALEVGVLLRR